MKKLYTLFFLSSLSYAQVTLPHYDGFDYTAGQALQTQTGWTLLNSGDDLLVTANNLSYSGLQASTGNKVTFDGTGIDAGKDFTSQTANTTYFSILLNITDLTNATSTTGGYQFGFVQGTSSNFGATIWIKNVDNNTYNIGINPRTTAANTVYASTNYSINQTYLVVGSYTFVDGTANDIVKLWINPVPGSVEPAPTATATNTGTDLTSASRFLVRQGSATDTPFIQFDELRIGTTWASVTPEAAANTNSNSISGLTMYPNPLKGNTLFITSTANAEMNVKIYNVLGKEVLSTKINNTSVDVSNLASGVYMVKITEEGKTATRKLVIQ